MLTPTSSPSSQCKFENNVTLYSSVKISIPLRQKAIISLIDNFRLEIILMYIDSNECLLNYYLNFCI